MKIFIAVVSILGCVNAQFNQQQFDSANGSPRFGSSPSNFGSSSSNFGSSSGSFNGAGHGANDGEAVHITKNFKLERLSPIVKSFYYSYGIADEKPKVAEATVRVAYQPEERVNNVFIRVPGQHTTGTDSNINLGNQIEEKTKVYILIKDLGEVKNVNDININLPNVDAPKPEVVFVKYKGDKQRQGVDVVSDIEVINGGDVDEETLNAGIVEAGGLQSIPILDNFSTKSSNFNNANSGGPDFQGGNSGSGVIQTITTYVNNNQE